MKINVCILLLVILTCAIQAQADPLTFSNVSVLQNNGNSSVDLFSNPNVTVLGPQLIFTVQLSGTLPPGGSDTLRATYMDAFGGLVVQEFQIPVFGVLQPPLTLFITINVPTVDFAGVPATFTVDLLGSAPDFVIPTTGLGVDSFTYSFKVAEPVPEPATLTLLAGGLAALFARSRQRYRKKG
jgi:hypothetical protein